MRALSKTFGLRASPRIPVVLVFALVPTLAAARDDQEPAVRFGSLAVVRCKPESVRNKFLASNIVQDAQSRDDLEQSGRPHPPADAHRHDDVFRAAPATFDQR